MTELIYQFLNSYVGDGMNITKRDTGAINRIVFTDLKYEAYNVKSDNGTMILYFIPNSIGDVKIYPAYNLFITIHNMFSIEPAESKQYLREWFREKYNIIHFRELLNHIPPPN
jgi:hypothetical protein